MNDRFKFRVWDKINDRWLKSTLLDIDTGYLLGYYDNQQAYKRRYVLQQCTGLKDKNGKLIYEGDIINCFDCRPYSRSFPLVEKGIITYKKAQFIVNTKFSEYLFEDIEDIEIIGNIYENKELLEGAEDE